MTEANTYAARIDIDYPGQMDRLSTLLRLFYALPILVIIGLISGSSSWTSVGDAGRTIQHSSSSITAGLFAATVLMLVFRQVYPRWWFDFQLELARFSSRVGAFMLLLTDRYPSTTEAQSVHLDVDYPDAVTGLNRWLPLIKWLLVVPHLIVLAVLGIAVLVVTVIAWISILVSGNYPRSLFDFVVGTFRWAIRVWAYAFLLVTDDYPPFSLQ